MRALVQRAAYGRVTVGGEVAGEIGPGLVILLGITHGDGEKEAAWLAKKCANLRIFEDDAGLMNRSLVEVGGAALAVSQFTLYGDASAGRRPSFTQAARPEHAEPLYEFFSAELRRQGVTVANGVFGAEMRLELLNDGPVTLLVETPE